jgi:hypothetical protein
MVLRRNTRWLVLAAGMALALPAGAAEARPAGPAAHAAGGDVAPLTPSIVGVPIIRTDKAINKAADAVDAGNGAQAVGPLRASRRYLTRSYKGAKYLIAHVPPPPAEEARVSARRFRRLARRFVRASRRGIQASWIKAHASDEPAGPAFADAPTAVFSVFTSQYSAATAGVGMFPDTKGNLQNRVKTTVNTAIVLRNRLVKIINAAEPPAPAEEGRVRARASQEEGEVATFATVMPGLSVLLDDEIQQIQATLDESSGTARTALQNALAADRQIQQKVNTLWPPAADD